MKKLNFVLTIAAKVSFGCFLSVFTILGMSQQAKGYDLEACAKDPIGRKPDVKNKIISAHPNSIVYFSSSSFVNWASTKNQGANVILSVASGGSFGAELTRQIEERLRTELTFMGIFASRTGTQLATEQIVSMMTGRGSLDLQGYRISVKIVNTPEVYQKCVVNGDCIPAIELPRLGFAIIATKI